MKSAHEALIKKGSTIPELKNMATTLTVAFIKNKQMHVVHAGDSDSMLFEEWTQAAYD
jgi:serine/threonine protein phosphatase PrpC